MRILCGSKSRCALTLAVGLLLTAPLADAGRRGRKYKPPPPTSNIKVLVVGAAHGKPIKGAAVIFHPVKNHKVEGSLELKSNTEGVAKINVIPVGDTLLLQVIKDGYNTFGKEYKIDSANQEIVVKMQPPAPQYSLYSEKRAPSDQNVTPKGESTSAKPDGQVPVPH